jgi:hypothetical protein
MPNPIKNVVIFLLDRSGSMKSIKASTIESFNTYLADLKIKPSIEFTLVTFDSTSTDIVHFRVPVGEVPDLTDESFQPRHSTPLIDAACFTIMKAKDTHNRSARVVITILTDGFENASTEFRMTNLNALVKETAGWGWQHVFLGAGIDAYRNAGQAGIVASKTMSFNASDRDMSKRAYQAVARKSRAYLDAAEQEILFTGEEKAAVGDRYRPS